MAEGREPVVRPLEYLEVLGLVACRVVRHASRGEDVALGGEQAARFRRTPIVEAGENAVLEVMQGVFLGVARSRPLDLRQGVDDEHAGDLEHGRGDDEGRVGVLQLRPLLELAVDALEVLAVLANGFLD